MKRGQQIDGRTCANDKKQTKDIAQLEAELAQMNQLVQEMTTELSSMRALNRRKPPNGFPATSRLQAYEMEKASIGKLEADSISVAEVAEFVKVLNAQIEQASDLVTDSLSYRELPSSSEDLGLAVWDELHQYLGSWLCDKLRRRLRLKSELDPLITQVALQAGLVNACRFIMNHWNPPYWNDSLALSRIYRNVARAKGQFVAGGWRAFVHGHMTDSKLGRQKANKDYIKNVLIKVIFAVGGSLPSGDALPLHYDEKVEDIAVRVVELHAIIGKEVKSMDLVAYVIPGGTQFDPSQMDDAGESRKYKESIPKASVVCTVEMGLRYKKRVSSGEQSRYYEDFGVVMKPKVVLAATLDA
ncbi:hypothetical protein JOM56_002859 [Amanita muscaria]